MSEYEELFKFAAKAGSLEGYLYERERLESLYGWVGNIEKMYINLPDAIKKDIRDPLKSVLTRSLKYGEKTLDKEIKERLEKLLLSL